MDAAPLLDRILDDEGLTAGLDEPEASVLVQTLLARVRELAAMALDERAIRRQVDELCRQARQIADIVCAFRDAGEAAARATATRNKLDWPVGADSPAKLLRLLLGAAEAEAQRGRN